MRLAYYQNQLSNCVQNHLNVSLSEKGRHSFKYPSSKKFKNFWKNILKNQSNSALLRNCALNLSSLFAATYFCECVSSNYNALTENLQCQPSHWNIIFFLKNCL